MGFHRTGCGHARLRMYVELVSVGPSQFIFEHYFRFPYLTEGVQHGLSKRNFPGTDRHRSQLRCNDPRASIIIDDIVRTWCETATVHGEFTENR